METMFNKFEWNAVEIKDVFRVNSGVAGTKINDGGNTFVYQIGLKLSGYTEIFYDGKKIDFREGTVLYLPKESDNSIDYHKTIMEQGESLCLFFDSDKSLPHMPIRVDCGDTQISELFFKLHKIYNREDRDKFYSMSIFYEILSMLDNTLMRKSFSKYDNMDKLARYMKEHCTDEYIDFNGLAKSMGMSIDYLRHRFKKRYGASPLAYVHELKINYIKTLICETEYSFGRIAQMSGFSDLNYFSRFFKKHTGMTPTEYRCRFGISAVV